MKKSKRGSFDFCSDGKIYFCKWNDSSVVSIGSICVSHLPGQTVKRRVKKDSNVSITQPQLIKKYNLSMGGVDVMDRLLGSYRPIVRGKKWYWSLIINAINISVVAAWQVHCAIQEKPMTHLEFRREITVCLLKIAMPQRRQIGGGRIQNLPNEVRIDGVGHCKLSTTQGRCKVCQKNTHYVCAKCNVRLHWDKSAVCFVIYHEDH